MNGLKRRMRSGPRDGFRGTILDCTTREDEGVTGL